MNILMLNYEYPPLGGGAAPVTKSLAEELVRQGHDVDVVTMGYKTLPNEDVINGVHIYRVRSVRKKLEMCTTHEMLSYCISATHFLPGLLKENRYEINHTHFIIPTGLVSRLYYKQIPYIITTHGSDVPGYNPDRFQIQHHLFKPFSNIVLDKASCITSPSVYLKKKIQESFGNRRVEIVSNGLSVESYHPRTKENKILSVSRLFERKGIQYVIEAMKGIEGFEYNICGDGPYKPSLERQIDHLNLKDRIKLHGYLEPDQLKREYESSCIFVLPSSSENFPMVLLEAMAAGCAIVTTDATGCAEVVGDTALLVRQKDPQGIQKALRTLICDEELRKDLGMRARARVEREFCWSQVAAKYVCLYQEVQNNVR
jgi:glycosyltransferase involved in cell wall biosynthesis